MFLESTGFEKLKNNKDSIFLVVCIMLVGLIGFGLGRLSARYQTSELNINSTLVNQTDLNKIVTTKETDKTGKSNTTTTTAEKESEAVVSRAVVNKKVVGNKNSKIFHYDDCPGALRMSETNKVFFTSILEAQQAGYKPAGNCPGLR